MARGVHGTIQDCNNCWPFSAPGTNPLTSNEQPDSKTESGEPGHYELVDPDVRLMLQVQEGSAGAFELLVRRYQRRIIAFLCQLAGADDAEDLAQEVFMRVYRARETYKPGARFSTWLYTIAHNVASNANRRASRRKEVNTFDNGQDSRPVWTMEALAQAPSGLMPVRQLDRVELSEIVAVAMSTLNERQRTAVYLSKFEGMGYQEIAETMQLTSKAVKSLLSRARANLRDILKPYLDSGHMPESSGPTNDPEQSGT
jgi:RNA polymerase sigma-70 factor (ECF subfamily)